MTNAISDKSKITLLTLRNKLILGFSVPIVLILLIAVLTVRSNNNVGAGFNKVANHIVPALSVLENLRFAGLSIISSTNETLLLYTLNAEDQDRMEEEVEIFMAQSQFRVAMGGYAHIILEQDLDDISYIEEINTQGEDLIHQSDAILTLIEAEVEPDEILDARESLEEMEISFLTVVDEAIQAELEDMDEGRDEVIAAVEQTNNSTALASVLAVIMALGLTVYIYRSTMSPLGKLENAAATIRQGRFDMRVPVRVRDEIGKLSETFNTMAAAIEYRDKEQIAKLEVQLKETETARVQAERSDQVKSAFLASMSHELRTPLNSVINFAKFLSRGMMGDVNDQQKETLSEITDHGEHLLSLINDVLDMSKIESGSLNLFIEDNVDVSEIMHTVIASAKSLIDEKPIEIISDLQEPLPSLRGDRQRILQIMLNIVSNACKFTRQGQIRISAKANGKNLEVAISDTGAGIAEADRSAVFESFRQTTTGLRRGGGTGLGMPISKSLTVAHGGQLWFESEVDKGTTFYLVLPILSEELTPIL